MSIIKMKKASIITLLSAKEEAVNKLKELGLLHINLEKVESQKLELLTKDRDILEKIISILTSSKETVAQENLTSIKTKEKIDEINKILEESSIHEDNLDKIEKEIKRIKPWGNFIPSDISYLEQRSVSIKLYEILSTEFDKFENKKGLFVVGKRDNASLVVSVNRKLENANEFELPTQALDTLLLDAQKEKTEIANLENKVLSYKKYTQSILSYRNVISEDIEFESVKGNLKEITDVPIATIEGFLPFDKVDVLKNTAKQLGWGIVLNDPSDEDKTPTKLKNLAPTKLIRPLINFIELSPGYKESDISSWFLIFFTIFFSMIVGDAGYGLIFFALGILASVMSLAKGKGLGQIHGLILLLSICTVGWGAATGTWFGSGIVEQVPALKSLTIPRLVDTNKAMFIQFLCFAIAIVHLTIAHGIGFVKCSSEGNFFKGLGFLGQLVMTIGLFYVVLSLIVGNLDIFVMLNQQIPNLSDICYGMIAGGFAFVFLFSSQDGSGFIKGVMASLSNIISLVLGIISGFADIISYIRLFAVGLAGSAISDSFNNMLLGGKPQGAALVISIVVLVLAHMLNIAMGLLSVLVHGVRLNVLEFSMHLGNEWAGIAYNPFRKKDVLVE